MLLRTMLTLGLVLAGCATQQADDASTGNELDAAQKVTPDKPTGDDAKSVDDVATDDAQSPDVVLPPDAVVLPDAPTIDRPIASDVVTPTDVVSPRDIVTPTDVVTPRDVVTPTCPTGRADCNGRADDGCEVDLAHDAANCGACGRAGVETFNRTDDDCDGFVDEGFTSNGLSLACTGSGLVQSIGDRDIDDGGGSSGGDGLQIYCVASSYRFCLSGEACPWRSGVATETGQSCSSAGLAPPDYFMAYHTTGYWMLGAMMLDNWFCPPGGHVRITLRATGLP